VIGEIRNFSRCEVDVDIETFGTKTPPAQDVGDSLVPSFPQQSARQAVYYETVETLVGVAARRAVRSRIGGLQRGYSSQRLALEVSPTRNVESAVTTETIRLAKIAASTRNAMAAVKKTAKHQRNMRLALCETNLPQTALTVFSVCPHSIRHRWVLTLSLRP
jgi:hypothetical protein